MEIAMLPRPPVRALVLRSRSIRHTQLIAHKNYATVAAVAPAAPLQYGSDSAAPIQRYAPTQPPSHKPPEMRKSQLHRQYSSLLQSTPVMLLFQHNNLKAGEWASIRRELTQALSKVPSSSTDSMDIAGNIRIRIIQTGIFAAALRVAEHYNPPSGLEQSVPAAAQHERIPTHSLSREAYLATLPGRRVQNARLGRKKRTSLDTLLSGPIALLTFPNVSPAHIAAALSILTPTQGTGSAFPAPKRKDAPGYYEPAVQNGLQKLLLLGARVEEGLINGKMKNKVMDGDGVRWLGGIQGGLGGLQAQLVHMLQGVGMGLASTLEGASRSLWVTMESRRIDMEEGTKSKNEETAKLGDS